MNLLLKARDPEGEIGQPPHDARKHILRRCHWVRLGFLYFLIDLEQ